MKLAILLTLLCGMAAFGQTKPQYTIELFINGKPYLLHASPSEVEQHPSGLSRVWALMIATNATVWTPKEWADVQKRECKDANEEIAQMFECPAAQPAQKPKLLKGDCVYKDAAGKLIPTPGDCGDVPADHFPSDGTINQPPAPSLSCAPECKLTEKAKVTHFQTRVGTLCPEGEFAGTYFEKNPKTGELKQFCNITTRELYLGNQKIGTLEEK